MCLSCAANVKTSDSIRYYRSARRVPTISKIYVCSLNCMLATTDNSNLYLNNKPSLLSCKLGYFVVIGYRT